MEWVLEYGGWSDGVEVEASARDRVMSMRIGVVEMGLEYWSIGVGVVEWWSGGVRDRFWRLVLVFVIVLLVLLLVVVLRPRLGKDRAGLLG